MKEGFRQSMAWLHTWTGLVVGWVLFFVFLTGTAGYVQVELTRWMQPEKALQSSVTVSENEQIDKAYHYLKHHSDAQNAERWGINLQTNQRGSDDFAVNWTSLSKEPNSQGQYHHKILDTTSGQVISQQIQPRETGGGFTLYRMHYALHYIPYDWGIRIVGICTMLMFIAIISGVITHKKILKDFFTFRPAKGQRSWLDAHNVISVIALPFYLMITYSGLIFFANAYMPLAVPMIYGAGEKQTERYYAELYPNSRFNQDHAQPTKAIGEIKDQFVAIQPLLAKVQNEWGAKDKISQVNFYPEQGANPAKIEFYQTGSDTIARKRTSLSFNLYTGQKIAQDQSNQEKAPMIFGTTVLGLHEGLFASPLLRIFYVITGFLGTAMIATGLVLWTVKRRPKQLKAAQMSFGHALVERLNIAMIAGLPLAIAIYFWANRLIPANFPHRADWEVHSLYITLLLSFLYGLSRPIVRAWIELLAIAAVAYLLLPLLNVVTTERHLGISLLHQDWVLASIDIGFILLGVMLAWASYSVWRKRDLILKPVVKKTKKHSVSKREAPIELAHSEDVS
ncbi:MULTISPECIES: PepSY-associated TM helix domain-containing protein [unclassified Acinetobacter]|uniref:PepSY-associated TM helix domain-containing protein n=1 Tax=unclassified Acinetobacter TaxID=196816 RepID=UPI002934B67F|nr:MULTISPECIES: PepSY-associated TM helix domain-containing protein [unclassified Acinetobacter]WOE31508.1 PepSY-associated TM helix domain-containing protein [Acinetobacter sp. SAAs470]WOE39704.1 PepSY-associated TM helix domain-containing protein [Acinetobacter sp. SAAs474]